MDSIIEADCSRSERISALRSRILSNFIRMSGLAFLGGVIISIILAKFIIFDLNIAILLTVGPIVMVAAFIGLDFLWEVCPKIIWRWNSNFLIIRGRPYPWRLLSFYKIIEDPSRLGNRIFIVGLKSAFRKEVELQIGCAAEDAVRLEGAISRFTSLSHHLIDSNP